MISHQTRCICQALQHKKYYVTYVRRCSTKKYYVTYVRRCSTKNITLHTSGVVAQQILRSTRTTGNMPTTGTCSVNTLLRTCPLLGPALSILYMYILYSTKSALPGTETPASHEQKVDSQVRHSHTISQPTQREPTPGTCPMTR